MSREDTIMQDNSYATILTPTKVKERLKNMKYEGDPDLIPIRSYEIAFLVRLLYVFACNINQQVFFNNLLIKYKPAYVFPNFSMEIIYHDGTTIMVSAAVLFRTSCRIQCKRSNSRSLMVHHDA